ncbi:MAG: DNA polymerase III subunit beta [Oscillospiraceae bacterium]
MKFVCNKQLLCEAIGNVSKAVALKSTISALEGIKIKILTDSIQLTGYDLELGIKTEIPVKSEGEGEFIVNSMLFNNIIRRMTSEEIEVSVDENLSTRIKGGIAEYDIVSLSSEEYPEIPEIDKEKSFSISQSILKNMINQTIFAVAINDNKPILTGELLEIREGSFNLVAIDGFRLAIRHENIDTQEKYDLVVPSKALKEISNLLKEKDDAVCTVYFNKKHIIFDISGYKVISRMLEGEFHNYKNSLPENSTTEAIIKTKDLIQSLERCSLLINDRVKAPVKCLFNNDEVKLSCITTIGKFNDAFKADISGTIVEIGFNCRYLLEALKATESDQVKLLMNGGLAPMKIVPLDGDSYTFLVLPVRLKA